MQRNRSIKTNYIFLSSYYACSLGTLCPIIMFGHIIMDTSYLDQTIYNLETENIYLFRRCLNWYSRVQILHRSMWSTSTHSSFSLFIYVCKLYIPLYLGWSQVCTKPEFRYSRGPRGVLGLTAVSLSIYMYVNYIYPCI